MTLGRAADAEPLVAALEANGARLDRTWMLAVGARCRAMMSADGGDLDAAERAARRAMVAHDRLPMPFETARTKLVLGQILRRRRQKQAAIDCCTEALVEFERIGAPLWAARATADLNRVRGTTAGTSALTPAERRVAERAVSRHVES